MSDFLAQDHLKCGIARHNIFRANSDNNERRRLGWHGHILMMSHNRNPRVALKWIPQSKRKHCRLKAIWRRTVEKEIETMGLTRSESERQLWTELVGDLTDSE